MKSHTKQNQDQLQDTKVALQRSVDIKRELEKILATVEQAKTALSDDTADIFSESDQRKFATSRVIVESAPRHLLKLQQDLNQSNKALTQQTASFIASALYVRITQLRERAESYFACRMLSELLPGKPDLLQNGLFPDAQSVSEAFKLSSFARQLERIEQGALIKSFDPQEAIQVATDALDAWEQCDSFEQKLT